MPTSANDSLAKQVQTYRINALEEDRLVARPCRETEGAHGLGRLVLVRHEQVVQALEAQGTEKPLARQALVRESRISLEVLLPGSPGKS